MVLAGLEQVEPMETDGGPDPALESKNLCGVDRALGGVEPMEAETESGQVLAPMDLNWLEAVLEVVVERLGSRVAELGVEFVMGPMHSLKVAVAVVVELIPKVVETDLVLQSVAIIVEEPDVVLAEPMVVVAGILVVPLEPKEFVLGIFYEVVASMVVDVESLFVMAVSIGAVVVAAFVLGLDSSWAAFSVDEAAQ